MKRSVIAFIVSLILSPIMAHEIQEKYESKQDKETGKKEVTVIYSTPTKKELEEYPDSLPEFTAYNKDLKVIYSGPGGVVNKNDYVPEGETLSPNDGPIGIRSEVFNGAGEKTYEYRVIMTQVGYLYEEADYSSVDPKVKPSGIIKKQIPVKKKPGSSFKVSGSQKLEK